MQLNWFNSEAAIKKRLSVYRGLFDFLNRARLIFGADDVSRSIDCHSYFKQHCVFRLGAKLEGLSQLWRSVYRRRMAVRRLRCPGDNFQWQSFVFSGPARRNDGFKAGAISAIGGRGGTEFLVLCPQRIDLLEFGKIFSAVE